MVLKELEMLGSHFRIETKEKETKNGPLQKRRKSVTINKTFSNKKKH